MHFTLIDLGSLLILNQVYQPNEILVNPYPFLGEDKDCSYNLTSQLALSLIDFDQDSNSGWRVISERYTLMRLLILLPFSLITANNRSSRLSHAIAPTTITTSSITSNFFI